MTRFVDLEREEEEARQRTPAPAPAPDPTGLLALQRSAGNQAVARRLQRAVSIGQPGMNPVVHAGGPAVAAVTAPAAARLGAAGRLAPGAPPPHPAPRPHPGADEVDPARGQVGRPALAATAPGV